jgi:hypothetical protein
MKTAGWVFPGRLSCIQVTLRLGLVPTTVAGAGRALLREALAAVDGLARRGLERNLRVPAAARAGGRIHLARPGGIPSTAATAIAAAAVSASAAAIAVIGPLRLAGSAAARATLGLGISALRVEGLLSRGKGKRLSAIAAGQGTITHSANFLSVSGRIPVNWHERLGRFKRLMRNEIRVIAGGGNPRHKHARTTLEDPKYSTTESTLMHRVQSPARGLVEEHARLNSSPDITLRMPRIRAGHSSAAPKR